MLLILFVFITLLWGDFCIILFVHSANNLNLQRKSLCRYAYVQLCSIASVYLLNHILFKYVFNICRTCISKASSSPFILFTTQFHKYSIKKSNFENNVKWTVYRIWLYFCWKIWIKLVGLMFGYNKFNSFSMQTNFGRKL